MENFDYDKIYYKVMNINENQHGYQYKDGLNILEGEFNENPYDSCGPGGFYFTDYKHLPYYFSMGIFIRKIRIPKDAKVVFIPIYKKFRTDKIILCEKEQERKQK